MYTYYHIYTRLDPLHRVVSYTSYPGVPVLAGPNLWELEWDRPASIVLIAVRRAGTYEVPRVVEELKRIASQSRDPGISRLAAILAEDHQKLARILELLNSGMRPRKSVLSVVEELV